MFWRRRTFAVVDISNSKKNLEKPVYYKKETEEYVEVINNIEEREEERRRKPFLGFLYCFLHTSSFVLSSVLVQKLSYITPGQLTFVRNAGVLCGSLPIAVFYVKNIFGEKKDRIVLIARSLLGTTALYLNVTAFVYLPLADAAILFSIMPVVTVLIARIYLKEPFGLTQRVSLGMTLIGVLLSIRLPEFFRNRSGYKFDNRFFIGIACAAGGILFLSSTYVALRKMKHVHFSIPMIYFGFLGMIENAVLNGAVLSYDPVHCGWDNVLYILIGATAFIANSFLTLSLQVETAGIVSVLKSSMEIVISIIFQIAFFKTYPDKYNFIGGFIIILSMSILGIRNWLLSLPKKSEFRNVFKFFLL